MKRVLTIVTLLPFLANAQLPSDHFFFLQVYNNGELIKKNGEYFISSSVMVGDERLENQCTNPELDCFTIPYGTELITYDIQLEETQMLLQSEFPIDKIDFLPGEFFVDKEFEDLFSIQPGPKVQLYPKMGQFNMTKNYVVDPTPHLECIHGMGSDFDTGVESWIVDVATYQNYVAVAVEQDDPDLASMIYVTGNNGEQWTQLTLHDKEAEIVNIEMTSDNDIYVKANSGGTKYYHTDTGGEDWTELKQSETLAFEFEGKTRSGEIGISTMVLSDAGLSFHVQKITDDKVDQLLTIKAWRPSVLTVHDHKETYVLGGNYLLQSTDQGMTWKFYPLSSCEVNSPDGLIVFDDGTMLIFGSDGLGFYKLP